MADKFESAKAAQGYTPAGTRDRCETCAHCEVCYGSVLQCRRGGFLVSRYGCCSTWAKRSQSTTQPPPADAGTQLTP